MFERESQREISSIGPIKNRGLISREDKIQKFRLKSAKKEKMFEEVLKMKKEVLDWKIQKRKEKLNVVFTRKQQLDLEDEQMREEKFNAYQTRSEKLSKNKFLPVSTRDVLDTNIDD